MHLCLVEGKFFREYIELQFFSEVSQHVQADDSTAQLKVHCSLTF